MRVGGDVCHDLNVCARSARTIDFASELRTFKSHKTTIKRSGGDILLFYYTSLSVGNPHVVIVQWKSYESVECSVIVGSFVGCMSSFSLPFPFFLPRSKMRIILKNDGRKKKSARVRERTRKSDRATTPSAFSSPSIRRPRMAYAINNVRIFRASTRQIGAQSMVAWSRLIKTRPCTNGSSAVHYSA